MGALAPVNLSSFLSLTYLWCVTSESSFLSPRLSTLNPHRQPLPPGWGLGEMCMARVNTLGPYEWCQGPHEASSLLGEGMTPSHALTLGQGGVGGGSALDRKEA